jgi:hypothetical protein
MSNDEIDVLAFLSSSFNGPEKLRYSFFSTGEHMVEGDIETFNAEDLQSFLTSQYIFLRAFFKKALLEKGHQNVDKVVDDTLSMVYSDIHKKIIQNA